MTLTWESLLIKFENEKSGRIVFGFQQICRREMKVLLEEVYIQRI